MLGFSGMVHHYFITCATARPAPAFVLWWAREEKRGCLSSVSLRLSCVTHYLISSLIHPPPLSCPLPPPPRPSDRAPFRAAQGQGPDPAHHRPVK
jgi:hypothetical protein